MSLAWLSDALRVNNGRIVYCPTDLQAADLYTKAFSNVVKFNTFLQLNGVYSPEDSSCVRKLTAPSHPGSKAVPVCIVVPMTHEIPVPFPSLGRPAAVAATNRGQKECVPACFARLPQPDDDGAWRRDASEGPRIHITTEGTDVAD